MFKQTDDQPIKEISNPETIIGPSMKVEGDFKGEGDVIVDGTVNGTLETKQNLKVGETAIINADVVAINAVVAGKINGSVTIKERLELAETAEISGDINTKVLQTDPGATINGMIKMEGGSELLKSEQETSKKEKKSDEKKINESSEKDFVNQEDN